MRKSIYSEVNRNVERLFRERPELLTDSFMAVMDATIAIIDENGIDKGCDICLTIMEMARA